MSDLNKAAQNGYSKIEYSNMETFDENDNLILTVKFKKQKNGNRTRNRGR